MKFDRQLRPATETSWVVSYDDETVPRWPTAAILKIDISPSFVTALSFFFHSQLYHAQLDAHTPSSSTEVYFLLIILYASYPLPFSFPSDYLCFFNWRFGLVVTRWPRST